MKKKLLTVLGICVFVLATTGISSASILTFDGLTTGYQYQAINANYGDNINSTSDAYGSYLIGNGFTEHITVSYNTAGAGSYLEAWDNGYGDLTNVAYADEDNLISEITLTADAGYKVTLNSFDLAGWDHADNTATVIDILNSSGAVAWSASSLDIEGTSGHSSYTPSFTDTSLTIRWGSDWNIGIDNINFDQSTSAVPVPGAAWLLGSGLLGLIGIRRRKQK